MDKETIPSKRLKLENDGTEVGEEAHTSQSTTVKAILSDEFTQPVKRCNVYVGSIAKPKLTSRIISELSRSLPLNDLNHLKRVNQSRVILCSVNEIQIFCKNNFKSENVRKMFVEQRISDDVDGDKDFDVSNEEDFLRADNNFNQFILQEFLIRHGISSDLIQNLCNKIEIFAVAAQQPILHWQYKDAILSWPCKFHSNKYLEKLFNDELFTTKETSFHIQIIRICRFLCKKLSKRAAGVAVDPRTCSIVAVGFDEIDHHPLMHCAMVLIDSVARSQNGGAWTKHLLNCDDDANRLLYLDTAIQSNEYTLNGVSQHIRKLIDGEFESIKFGAECVKDTSNELALNADQQQMDVNNASDNLAKYGPYLCTGYDIYLSREPCTMCSMALTHSRARRIFFNEIRQAGAICSLVKLQSVKALNHHFEAFHIDSNE